VAIEKRTFISFKDILAIEYECPHCHVRQSVPIDKVERLVFNCPNCNELLIKKEGGLVHDDVLMSKFFHSIKEIQLRDFSAILRLQITTIDES
jgi:predicted RNA-binding Zn-ribbon protein involved in translation (DUF1610 family)